MAAMRLTTWNPPSYHLVAKKRGILPFPNPYKGKSGEQIPLAFFLTLCLINYFVK